MRDMTDQQAVIAAAVERAVADAPPLTEEQIDRLRALLATPRPVSDYRPPFDLAADVEEIWTN